MGVVAVLHPQDCLRQDPIPFPRVKPARNPTGRPQPTTRRKRSPPSRAAARATNTNNGGKQNGPVQGQVKILKRGETLPEMAPRSSSPTSRTSDLGLQRPIPKPANAESKPIAFYAGSAFITSPPPSSLPLPAFFKKKVVVDADVDPTRALQRLLGLRL